MDRKGLWLGVAAYAVWGVAPVFWKTLGDVPPIQQTAHRILWAVPILAVAVAASGRLRSLRAAARRPRTLALAAVSSALLSVNWVIYVWAVATERVVEASLGYFINPLVSVALGVVLLGERLRAGGVVAVALASTGVAYLTIRLGEVPWIALALAGTFAVYGLLKKRPEAAQPLEGLAGETALAWIPALGLVVVLGVRGQGSFGTAWPETLLLVAAGAVTAVPLLLFGAAAQRIPLSAVGLLQYLAPTGQLMLGALAFGEPVTADQMIGFAFVWAGLAVFTASNLAAARRGLPAPGAGAPAG